MRKRRFRDLHPVGRRNAEQVWAGRRQRPGFRMPEPGRWRRDLDFHGLRPVVLGMPQARRLLGWARKGRADGRVTRRWVARALLRQHRHHPGEDTIAAGHQQLADEIADKLGGPRLSRQTVCRIVTEMQVDGVLYLARRGCSAAVTGDRNLVSVYVVVEPDTLDDDAQQLVDELAARLVEHHPEGSGSKGTPGETHARRSGRIFDERPGPQRREHPERYAPRNGAERAASVDWLIADQGWQAHAERARRELPTVTAPLFAAGWSARGIAVAIGRRPDGLPHLGPLPGRRQQDRRDRIGVRNLWAVLTWRLSLWAGHEPPPVEVPRRGRPKSAVLPTVPAARTAPPAAALAALAAAGLRAGALRA